MTGSGKTLAFLLPLVHRILRLEEPTKKHHIAAIVIAPTRELAIQIHKTLTDLVAFHPASVAVAPFLSSDEEKRPSTCYYGPLFITLALSVFIPTCSMCHIHLHTTKTSENILKFLNIRQNLTCIYG